MTPYAHVPVLQVYKVEREAGVHISEPVYSCVSPRGNSSAGSCGTPDPRTPLTPRPASQQER